MKYKIKISGEGAIEEIIQSLRDIADAMENEPDTIEKDFSDDIYFEDETLLVEVNQIIHNES